MRPGTRARRRLGVCACLLVALTTVAGCGAVEDLNPVTTASDAGTAGITVERGTDVFALSVGDCVDAIDGDLHSGVRLVPCSDSHDWEIYLEAVVPGTGSSGEGYPGAEVLLAAAEADCGAQFGVFLGLDPAADPAASTGAAVSELGFTYVIPSEAEWSAHTDPVVSCLIGSMSGPVSGSLAGAAG